MKTLTAFEADGNGWVGLQVVHEDPGEPLSACVRTALRQYLAGLDGHEVHDLYRLVLEEVERPMFATVLEHTGGNQTMAAKLLGMSRSTLRKRLAVYQLGDES
jgi:Fis family transcriptional regulator